MSEAFYVDDVSIDNLYAKDLTDSSGRLSNLSVVSRGNIDRIVSAMKKAQRRRAAITIGVIGGSITEGAGASTTAKRYADLMKQWWQAKFPSATINYINAGIGATGSYIGVHRVQENLLYMNPDFVVVEYAVNDGQDPSVIPYYEELVRRIYNSSKNPAVMLMFMTTNSGTNAQAYHSQVGTYYNLPMASYRDAIWPEIVAGRIASMSCFMIQYIRMMLGIIWFLSLLPTNLMLSIQILQLIATRP